MPPFFMIIYLDNNSTTQPLTGLAVSAAQLTEQVYGNPSSGHEVGSAARKIIDAARKNVATAIGCKPNEIIFTSGGTEANNIACRSFGTLSSFCTELEHSSVSQNCKNFGANIPTKKDGTLNITEFSKRLDRHYYAYTVANRVFSVMLVNNETGVITDPTFALKKLKEDYGFMLHIDAVAGFGKGGVCWDPDRLGADLMSISGHKIHALKGAGALYVKEGIQARCQAVLKGGLHESGMRAGTENIIGIHTLGEMCKTIVDNEEFKFKLSNVADKRDLLESLLSDVAEINGNTEHRISNVSNLYFKEVRDLELFLHLLDESGVVASGMSACQSGLSEPSKVLTAMYGKGSERLAGSVRFSLSAFTTEEEIRQAAVIIKEVLQKVSSLNC